MKKVLNVLVISVSLILLTGCRGLLSKNEGVLGKSSKNIAAATENVRSIDTKLAETDQDRLTHIGAWSKGVEYSLDKSTNTEDKAISTAKVINTRVEELANKPDLNELKQVYKIIDSFLTNAVEGQKLLDKKDKEIIELQNSIASLDKDKKDAIKEYADIAESNAAKADQYQATLKQLDSGWGLSAVWYGLKKFATHIAWIFGIGTVLFIILRVLATTNPIASAIFGIFDQMGSWFIHTIAALAPKALSVSKLVEQKVVDDYKVVVTKLVDTVEQLKASHPSVPSGTSVGPTVQSLSPSVIAQTTISNLTPTQLAIVNTTKSALNYTDTA
jgi:hypothetical protein